MNVSYTDYKGQKKTISLSEALVPRQPPNTKGVEVVAAMLAIMVEKEVLTLSEALEISGQSYSLRNATLVP